MKRSIRIPASISHFSTYTEDDEPVAVVIVISFVNEGDTIRLVELFAYPDDAQNAWDEMVAQVAIDCDAPFEVCNAFPQPDEAESRVVLVA